MANPDDPQRLEDELPASSHPVSFVMRCWVVRGDTVRARLTEVRTGVSYPLADLADLPALVRSLVLDASLPSSSTDSDLS